MDWVTTLDSIFEFGKKAVDIGLILLEREVTRYSDVEKGLEKIKGDAYHINSKLEDAEQRRYIKDESVKYWLRDLRSVYFEADDIQDEYQTALDMHRRQSGEKESWYKRKWHQITVMSPQLGPIQRRRFALQIDNVNSRLAQIERRKKYLMLKSRDEEMRGNEKGKRALDGAMTSESFDSCLSQDQDYDPAIIIGREKENDVIVQLLISDHGKEGDTGATTIPVFPIQGTSGIGKTALARSVYGDRRIRTHFDIRAWVTLTDSSDVNAAMKTIYEQITSKRCAFSGLADLQDHLRDYLKKTHEGHKFLLVIDNLWAIDCYFLEDLRIPLLAVGDGMKILITTRNMRTCQIMHGLQPATCLGGLNEEDCWKLISHLALPPGFNRDPMEFVPVGKEIAKRCYGSPLAAKALGAILYGKRIEVWYDVLNEMRTPTKKLDEIVLAILEISYVHLPYKLKQCFSYCSIFPDGYMFDKDQVNRYWLGAGLIDSVDTQYFDKRPNSVDTQLSDERPVDSVDSEERPINSGGTQNFDELIWISFFEKVIVDTKGQVERYRMPRLVQNLAKQISKYESRGLKSGVKQAEPTHGHPNQAHYASFLQLRSEPTAQLECLDPYPYLRTIIFFHECHDGVVPLNSMPASFFHKFKHLRVLNMNNSDLEQVPDSVGELIHLRFLGLSKTQITTLPDKICNLYNLQTLELNYCFKFALLPQGLGRLINLQHLDFHLDWEEITDTTEVVLPHGIGGCEKLRVLSRFNVAADDGQFSNINELKNLWHLRGDLCLLNLEKVSSTEDATNANLEGKKFVEKLMLRWHSSALADGSHRERSEGIIKCLQPHNSLKCLWVVNYPGNNFPDWMGSVCNLETIVISKTKCNSSEFLTHLKHLPWLKNLQVDNVPGDTMDMPEGFPSLEYLRLLHLQSLTTLTLANEIPRAKQIYVYNCLGLKKLVIHKKLPDKFERQNCSDLVEIILVPKENVV